MMLRSAVRASFDSSYIYPADDGFRNEIKYTLSPDEYFKLRDICAGFMEHDRNAGADGEYVVKSHYFDTLYFQDYAEKQDGIYARQKYRLRTYGDTGYYRLEKKIKRGNLNMKISGEVSFEDAGLLIQGDTSVRTGNEHTDAIIEEMQLKGCRSSVYIQYLRRVFTLGEPGVRITFDRDVGMLFGTYNLSDSMPDPIPVFYNDETIMEVKYKEKIPGWLQKAIYKIAPSEFSVSKYAHSIEYFLR